jgi:NADH-quinone oxidoreductase subunit D
VPWDTRKARPYSAYDKFDFKIPTHSEGDVYVRYLVRVEEMRESLKIVRQAIDGLPEGPIKADAPHIVMPDRESMKTSIEALIYHFKIVTEGFHPPIGEVYQTIESPRGRTGLLRGQRRLAQTLPLPRARPLFCQSPGAGQDG